MRRLALPLLVVLMIASTAFIATTAGELPEQVASHFGASGVNGWMARHEYVLWMLLLATVIPLAIVALIAILPRVAPRLVNLPHRAYWLSDAQRDQTLASLLAFACWQACLLTAFAAGLHGIVLEANATSPPRLPGALFVALLTVFLGSMAVWTAALYARFRTMH